MTCFACRPDSPLVRGTASWQGNPRIDSVVLGQGVRDRWRAIGRLVGPIPSPTNPRWQLGRLAINPYVVFVTAGVVTAVLLGDRRWRARGGDPGFVGEVALVAVPFGVVGARAYHVGTDWHRYFGPNGKGLRAAMNLWLGGRGIWGAISAGVLGAWIVCRWQKVSLPAFLDAVAPGVPCAQAVGRLGNWYLQELFGRPTNLPWALQISPANRPRGFEQYETFHPTFLYESLVGLSIARVLVIAERRYQLGHGRVFALMVALYCPGRLALEFVRIDSATRVRGLRINVYTSLIVGASAIVYLALAEPRRPGHE